MKILGILGSPRVQGAAATLLDTVLDGARQAGASVERVNLSDLKLNFCASCGACYRSGACTQQDDFEALKAKLLAADGVVLASPVYVNSVPGQVKTLMDRCSYLIHCLLLDGKYAAAVATAGGSRQDEVAEYQNQFLSMCGAQIVGAVGALTGTGGFRDPEQALAQAIALGKELAAAIAEKRQYPEQAEAHKQLFTRLQGMIRGMGPAYSAQYQHWEERGWL